jgi:DNA invertase Pin-like site-specific DNA recombinase
MSKSCVYVRYSPRPDELCESLEIQKDFVTRYFDFLNIEVGEVIGDPETSARLVPLAKRKGGARLLELTTGRKPRYNIVGAYRLDRLWRDVIDGISTLGAWRDAGVACHFAAEGGQSINTATATGRFIVNVLLSKAAYEPDLTAERTSAAMKHHQSNGRIMSKEPQYGLQVVDGMLIPNPAEEAVIERVKALRTNGHAMGYREIARLFTHEGVPSRGAKGWHHSGIASICRRMETVKTAAV